MTRYGYFGTANPVPDDLTPTVVHETGPQGPKESERETKRPVEIRRAA